MSLLPDFHCASVAAFSTYPDSLWVIPAVSKWRRSPSADPFTPTRVALFLLFQAFAKFLQQLFKTTERLDLGFFFISQIFLKFSTQPVFRYQCINDVINTFHFLEPRTERPVKTVEVLLVLDETCPRQKIEVINRSKRKPRLQRLQHHQVLFDRDRDAALLQGLEETDQQDMKFQSRLIVRAFPPRHECQPLQHMHILLILKQSPIQRRYCLAGIARFQNLFRDVVRHQQFQPVNQLRS